MKANKYIIDAPHRKKEGNSLSSINTNKLMRNALKYSKKRYPLMGLKWLTNDHKMDLAEYHSAYAEIDVHMGDEYNSGKWETITRIDKKYEW